MWKILVPALVDAPKYRGNFNELLKDVVARRKMLAKLKEIVLKGKAYEEESLQYKYKGKDKDEIWSCMEFFYANLWNPTFKEYVWTDPTDNWENYHITLKYQGRWAEVQIVYGIGSFCVIGPGLSTPWTTDLKYLDLDKIIIKTTLEVIYDDERSNNASK